MSARRSRSPDRRRSGTERDRERDSPAVSSGSRYEHSSRDRRGDDRRLGDRDRDSGRESGRDRGGDRDRDRDYRDRDRDRDRRERSRDRYRDPRDRDDRSRRDDRDRDRERDRDDRRRDDRPSPRDRRDDHERDRPSERSKRWDERPSSSSAGAANARRDSPPRKSHPASPPRSSAPHRNDREPSRDGPAPRGTPMLGSISPRGSPIPSTGNPAEDEKQRQKRERLEAWKKERELKKLKEGKGKSETPEPSSLSLAGTPSGTPDRKATASRQVDIKPPLSKLNGASSSGGGKLSMGALGRIGLPIKSTPLKRTLALDDEEASERKLVKMELPDFNPDVQSGPATGEEAIGDDLAAEEVDGEDVKPDITAEVGPAANAALVNGHVDANEPTSNGDAKPDADGDVKMDDVKPPSPTETKPTKGKAPQAAKVEEEDEEDELDAFMRSMNAEVRQVDREDAKRQGLMGVDNESDDEEEVKNPEQDKLLRAEEVLAQAAQKTRKKDLPTPDHHRIEYEPFRKAFYNPPVEALEMDEEETELMRLEMDGIKVRGVDAPRPVKHWTAFGLPNTCLEVIRASGWERPTSIQAQAIPAIMSGRDVIGIAKTGSGKTIAFLLPLFRHVKDQRPVGPTEGPIALVLSPTRELAGQIHKECKPFMKAMNMRVSLCVGGSSISEDIAAMKKGAEIVVCTPGRMIDLLTANNGRVTNMRRCTYMVMDEADRMFDMGFEPQVMKIVNNTRPTAQKVLFSATFPKTMEGLARKILDKPLEITVGGRSVVAAEIDQRVEVREQDSKFTRLLEILGDESEKHKDDDADFRTLIFVDRQEWADDLFRDLLQRGYICASLHGGKEQVDREDAIRNFKSGDVPIIVATSVAARGLDVPELRLVINYDAPNHMEDYVHRAGRTGRAGNTGVCVTFITPEQEKLSIDIVRALEASNAFVPPGLKAMSDSFLGKIKSGEARAAKSGFIGKGLERLDRKREEKDRAEKHTYGDTSEALSLSSREGAVIPYKPKEASNLYKPPERNVINEQDYTFTEIDVKIVHGPAPDKVSNPILYSTSRSALAQLPEQTIAAIQKAKAEGRTVDAANLAKVVMKLTQHIELTKAEKFGLAALGVGINRSKDPDATDYHAVFPINDYPQKARWKVTNKENMTLLNEHSGASVTMRGIYYAPGEEPKIGGEPKLHLLVESNDEDKVRSAVDEIRRNLVEASMAALDNADRGISGGGGRYAV